MFFQALEVHNTFVPTVVKACAILLSIHVCVGDIQEPEAAVQADTAKPVPVPGPAANEYCGETGCLYLLLFLPIYKNRSTYRPKNGTCKTFKSVADVQLCAKMWASILLQLISK